MAKDVSGNPWILDTVGDAEGFANKGVVGVVHGEVPPYVQRIVIVTDAAGGTAIVKEKSGGRVLVSTPTLDPETTYVEEIDHPVKGVFIDTLPAGATVYVHHGQRWNS